MADNAPPSSDPANDDSLAGTLREAYRKFLQATDDMLPAVVVAYDRDKNRANVQPCITLLTTDNRIVPRAPIASVPVMQMGGGGVVLNFNLNPGDFGWVKANDRDISMFLQSYNVGTPPNTLRFHTFQDAVFIPDVMRGWTIAGEDADAAVLQTTDGNARVSVNASRVKLAFGAVSLVVDASGVTMTVGGKVFALTGSGSTITGGLAIDGLGFGGHRHTGVAVGGATSGGPVP